MCESNCSCDEITVDSKTQSKKETINADSQNAKYDPWLSKSDLLDELYKIHTYLAICQAASDNSNFADINKEIASFIGEIASLIITIINILEIPYDQSSSGNNNCSKVTLKKSEK